MWFLRDNSPSITTPNGLSVEELSSPGLEVCDVQVAILLLDGNLQPRELLVVFWISFSHLACIHSCSSAKQEFIVRGGLLTPGLKGKYNGVFRSWLWIVLPNGSM